MNRFARKYSLLVLGLVCAGSIMSSCNDEVLDPFDQQREVKYSHKCMMTLDASKPSYNNVATRATSSDWEDGSTIYLSFQNNGKNVLGMATYSSCTGLWEVAYGGSLSVISNGKCSLYYFENADDINTKGASIGGTTGIFEDSNGIYAFDGDKIAINAKLTPKLGRVRFSGNKNDTIMLAGVKRYAYFDASDCSFKLDSTEVLLSATIQEGDKYYTPYYYGAMIEGNQTLELTEMKDAYSRYCSDIFKAGNSGYMKIPTAENFSGWMKNNPLSQSSVAINWSESVSELRRSIILGMINDMIKVDGGCFYMGSQPLYKDSRNYNTEASEDEYPVHKVTLSPFYMSRLEITNRQYCAVMKDDAAVSSSNDYPYNAKRSDGISKISSFIIEFVQKLNEITGLTFCLPSEAEWEYVAQGGRNGSYKRYAGTNTYSDNYFVATSSNYTYGGTKFPNEIGFHDMSGNVAELCSSVGKYDNNAIINPRAQQNEYFVRGGSSHELYVEHQYYNTKKITITNRSWYRSRYTSGGYPYDLVPYVGFRIAMRLINY